MFRLMILVFTWIADGDSCIGYVHVQYPTMASLDFLELCHVKPNWPDCVIPGARNRKGSRLPCPQCGIDVLDKIH